MLNTHTMDNMKKGNLDLKQDISMMFAIIAFSFALGILDIGCPIKYLTGVSCPGCGITRAFFCFFRGDLREAFAYNPMFFVAVPFVIFVIFERLINRKLFKVCIALICISLILTYIYRMLFMRSDVVVFNPREGLLYKIIVRIKEGLNYVLQ